MSIETIAIETDDGRKPTTTSIRCRPESILSSLFVCIFMHRTFQFVHLDFSYCYDLMNRIGNESFIDEDDLIGQ